MTSSPALGRKPDVLCALDGVGNYLPCGLSHMVNILCLRLQEKNKPLNFHTSWFQKFYLLGLSKDTSN